MDQNRHNMADSEFYRDLFDNIIDSVCILSPDGTFLDVNQAMTEMSGYSREELLQMRVSDFVHPEDQEKSREYFRNLKKQGSYVAYSGRFIDRHGNLKHIEVSSKAFHNEQGEMIGSRDIIRDVTEKKRIEADLINSEKKFRTVVTDSQVIFFMLDRNGEFMLSEGKGLEALGLKPGEAVGASVYEMYRDNADILNAVRLAMNGTSSKVINQLGDVFFDTFYSPYVDQDGNSLGVIGLAVDISERIHRERELEEAKKRAEESDQLKTAFLANLSHEIRTPMNAILGFSALLGNDNLSDQDRMLYLDIVQSKGNELLQLLTDMINVSQIEAGIISLNREYIPLNTLLSEFATVVRHELESRNKGGIEVRLSIPREEVIINNDENKLRQVLNNLLQNAIKFTEEGFIELGYKSDAELVSVFMKDTGIGISEEHQKVVFERFRQADDTMNRSTDGTGLGLYICKTLVAYMGGEIWVESSPNQGSLFNFTLPMKHS